jgi:hypothetical protein
MQRAEKVVTGYFADALVYALSIAEPSRTAISEAEIAFV